MAYRQLNSTDNSTLKNYQLYTPVSFGASPVSLDDMKTYLAIPLTNTTQDDFVQNLIDACTYWGMDYTGREFMVNEYTLTEDYFETRSSIRRNPVDTIDSVKYTDTNGDEQTVDSSWYYLKNGVQLSEMLLDSKYDWPDDVIEREQSIVIQFKTKAIPENKLAMAIAAIKRHVAYMFANRGDCGECGDCSGADAANVEFLYNMFRIARI